MKRRSPRIITRVIVFLLLGAIVNVAVAWTAALYWPVRTEQKLRDGSEWSSPGCLTTERWHFEDTSSFQRWLYVRAGWPFSAVGGNATWERDPCVFNTSAEGLWMSRRTRIGLSIRAVPFQPIPIGFAINTVFYAVILWVLFAAPFALRRRIRIRRGLCPACAYPVGDSPVCTECGKPLIKQKAQKQKAEMT